MSMTTELFYRQMARELNKDWAFIERTAGATEEKREKLHPHFVEVMRAHKVKVTGTVKGLPDRRGLVEHSRRLA